MKIRGFTLLESLTVLLIITLFTLLPVLSFYHWQQRMEVELFFDSFETMIQSAQHLAITRQRVVKMTIGEEEIGYQMMENNTTLQRMIEIPEQLQLTTTSTQLDFPGISGNYSGLAKVTFDWPHQNQRVIYQFQLGSGRFERKDR